MDEIFKRLKKDKEIKRIYLHMQFGNDAAISFYKKFGFVILKEIEDFYTDIEPKNCYFMMKKVNEEEN